MSQELQVLQCYSCETFQTQIVKKSNKWICKICNEKQSLKKVFGQGSGKDCRLHCQKLNALRGNIEDNKALTSTELDIEDNCSQSSEEKAPETMTSGSSKWSKFLSQPSDSDSDDDIKLDARPSQLLLPQPAPESMDIPIAKKFRNDFGQSEHMEHMLFNSDDDHCFDIDIPEDSIKIPSLQNCESLKKIDLDGQYENRSNFSENSSSKLCDNPVNFDLLGDDLMDDTGIEGVCDTNIFQGASVLKSKSRSENKSNLCVKTIKVSNPVNVEVKSTKTNDHAIFKMVPSNNLVVEQLKNRISLLEDINLYTLDQLTDMCKF